MTEDWLEEVAELMQVVNDRGDVEFLELIKGDMHVRFSRSGSGAFNVAAAPAPAPAPAPVAAAPVAAAPASAPAPVAISEQEGTTLVLAPMVGTFYRASAPGAPPFAEIGTTVTPDATMALVERLCDSRTTAITDNPSAAS